MKTKLTLFLKKSTADRIKQLPMLEKKSISGFIEGYLENLGTSNEQTISDISPTIKSLVGCLKTQAPENYKKEIERVITEKYLF